MNIIFIGTCGVYHPLIAAHLHMNKLNTEDYRIIKYFGDHIAEKSGKPLAVGTDSRANNIYALGVGPDVNMVKKSLEDLKFIFSAAEDDLIVIPIVIKKQLLLLILHKLTKLKPFGYLLFPWITYIIKKQLPVIKKQLQLSLGEAV